MIRLHEIRTKTGGKAVFTFGRMNPPSVGHQKLVTKVLELANTKRAKPFIFLSQTQDSKKNPLKYAQKIKYLKNGIPAASKAIINKKSIRTIFDAMQHMIDLGYDDITLVVGQDRVAEFQNLIQKYIDTKDDSKRLVVNTFGVVSAGERDPDADDVVGWSSSKLRAIATSDNFDDFWPGLPSGLSFQEKEKLFRDVRVGLNLESINSVSELNSPEIEKLRKKHNSDIETFKSRQSRELETLKMQIKAKKATEKEQRERRREAKIKQVNKTFTSTGISRS